MSDRARGSGACCVPCAILDAPVHISKISAAAKPELGSTTTGQPALSAPSTAFSVARPPPSTSISRGQQAGGKRLADSRASAAVSVLSEGVWLLK